MNRWRPWFLTLSLFAAGCTCGAFDPDTTRFSCAIDADCGSGFVCAKASGGLECVRPGDAGPAVDAGSEPGLDRDNDRYPLPADCNDGEPDINPGALESCANGIDDNCDQTIDCADRGCEGRACVGGGICVGGTCTAMTEVLCNDGADNDGDGLVDCADPDCPFGVACDDKDLCTTGERCGANAVCQKQADVVCSSPPSSCFSAGVCSADAGGCVYARSGAQSCDDGSACTVRDACQSDGGCAGSPDPCTPPTQCHLAVGACEVDAGCRFSPRTGGSCRVGELTGVCNMAFACVVNPPGRFPYVPSNFTEQDLPTAVDAGVFAVTCETSITTAGLGGNPSITSNCVTLPPYVLLGSDAGTSVLFLVDGLSVSSGKVLTLQGPRPFIFAVLGDVQIDGQVLAGNAANSSQCGQGGAGSKAPGGGGTGFGGPGGGGFGAPGGAGGPTGGGGAGLAGIANGSATLIPLRAGCSGGNGGSDISGTQGGPGGGALQISSIAVLTLNGVVAARGRGGGAGIFPGSGGGGGGSGGALLFEGSTVLLTTLARVAANGGGGGEAGSSQGASPGADGALTNSIPAPGGSSGSANSGNGGSGGTGSAAATAGTSGSTGDQGGGGGGGAAGRIRINASTSCLYDPSSLRTPAATSNGACL